MGNWSKVVLLLVIISVGFAFGGYLYYKNEYVKPREEIEAKRQELLNGIQSYRDRTQSMTQGTARLESLYSRSFPLIADNASLQYEMWLTQMLEFCNIKDPRINKGNRSLDNNRGLAVQAFQVKAECELRDLTQFLYEFYWSPFLHRLTSLDIQPRENSELLSVLMTIEGLTIMRQRDPRRPQTPRDQLPIDAVAPRVLSSGPYAAYSQIADQDIFRAVRTGVDETKLTILTGLPIFNDENGVTTKFSRWNVQSLGKTISLKIDEQMKIGSFVATVVDIDDNFVLLRQNNGQLWTVTLGSALSDAVAVPNNLY